jgi:hypothetical protein
VLAPDRVDTVALRRLCRARKALQTLLAQTG